MIIKKLTKAGLIGICFFLTCIFVQAQSIGDKLSPWAPGMLDLHHIQTGRGDAAFYIFPDGTTMVVDAGDMSESSARVVSPRNTVLVPDDSKTAGEWIVDYIRSFHPKGNEGVLDYALLTHFHDDHIGEIDHTSKDSKWGDYKITGISEVGEHIPVRKLVDRGYPDYNIPVDMKSPEFKAAMLAKKNHYDSTAVYTMENYLKFIEAQSEKRGLKAEMIAPGSDQQFVLNYHNTDYPGFTIRNMYGSGTAWTGWEDKTFPLFADKNRMPGENSLSIGIRISYGAFDYFTGGDIAGNDGFGRDDIHSVEAKVAPVVGPVDVATLNHHGNRDSQSAYFVRTIRPRVWIQQVWSSDHPGDDVLRRIMSEDLYPGERYLFATAMLEANKLVLGGKVDQAYQSMEGHVVVRVLEGGDEYMIYVLDETSPERRIKKMFGPIQSR